MESACLKDRTWPRRLRRLALALVLTPLLLELICFVAITLSNYVIYGQPYEGSRAIYDAHTVFLQQDGRRETCFNVRVAELARNRTVWLFGGSTMRGSTDDDARTIASGVARRLNEQAATGLCYTVVNWGVDSFNSLLEVKYLQKCLIEETNAPDLVLFYDGANDATYFVEYRTPYAHFGYRQLTALIGSGRHRWLSLLKPLLAAWRASYTREALGKLTAVALPLAADDPDLQRFAELTGRRYDHAQRLAAAYGARFQVAWQPMLWVETEPVDPGIRAREQEYTLNPDRFRVFAGNVRTVYGVLRDEVTRRPDAVCLQNALCSRTGLVYRADGVHLTDYGRECVAEVLAGEIRRRFTEAR